ncbi:uncharacterized protein LOC108836033 [Raphanus sativus]|uniref:Uncharacterized protein LOC108836033 n=1 Tax=Raphanus sativus TaxID=3726 RepID=A0A9W3CQM1_RAPSA|nr:uncharacterized protein LOC108836033 [Raphanus sativus]
MNTCQTFTILPLSRRNRPPLPFPDHTVGDGKRTQSLLPPFKMPPFTAVAVDATDSFQFLRRRISARRLRSLIPSPSRGRAGRSLSTTSSSKLFSCLTETGRRLKLLLDQKL